MAPCHTRLGEEPVDRVKGRGRVGLVEAAVGLEGGAGMSAILATAS